MIIRLEFETKGGKRKGGGGARRRRGGGRGPLPTPSLEGFGDIDDGEKKRQVAAALIDKAKQVGDARLARFSKSMTFTTYVKELSDAIAQAGLAEKSAAPAVRDEIRAIKGELAQLLTAAQAQAKKTPSATITPLSARTRIERLQNAIYRQMGGVAETLGRKTFAEQIFSNVTEAPGDILKWAGKSIGEGVGGLGQGLGVPPWLIPVGAAVVGLVILAPNLAPLLAAARVRSEKKGAT